MPLVIFIDLPTYPKGTISLSLPYLSALFSPHYQTQIIDLNLQSEKELLKKLCASIPVMVGIKVSAQNYHIACSLSDAIKKILPKVKIVWGGEYPTLMPGSCTPFADSIVVGLFDLIAPNFINDLKNNVLLPIYEGGNDQLPESFALCNWANIPKLKSYNRFMGIPLETSRGCTEVCTFCMVHTMQKKHYHLKPPEILKQEIDNIGPYLINIIDYNFGVDKQHVINTCGIIEKSQALGFMAEMCLDMLDDEDVLRALQKARCKMIYCGLETITEDSLKAVHKMNTNHIENYRRIINRAKQFGVQVASGFILAIDNTKPSTFNKTLQFFEEVGIMYVKLTFLTYNPGTRAQKYYQKRGTFLHSEPQYYDGNHISYLPAGVNADEIYAGTEWFIKNFYSFRAIIGRSLHFEGSWTDKLSFVCFNVCYGNAYLQWLNYNIFESEENFLLLLNKPYKKPAIISFFETILLFIWKRQLKSIA
jgi:hypothetical protein